MTRTTKCSGMLTTFPTRGRRDSKKSIPHGAALTWAGQYGQRTTTPLTFPTQSVWISTVKGVTSASPPRSAILSVVSAVSYSWIVVSCSPCGGVWCQNDLGHHPGDVTFALSPACDITDLLFFEVLSSVALKTSCHPISFSCNHSNHPTWLLSAVQAYSTCFLSTPKE